MDSFWHKQRIVAEHALVFAESDRGVFEAYVGRQLGQGQSL